MKKSFFESEEFFEFKLNPEAMNKLHGGDSPTRPPDPPVPPPGK